jgi:hypothetical protein
VLSRGRVEREPDAEQTLEWQKSNRAKVTGAQTRRSFAPRLRHRT